MGSRKWPGGGVIDGDCNAIRIVLSKEGAKWVGGRNIGNIFKKSLSSYRDNEAWLVGARIAINDDMDASAIPNTCRSPWEEEEKGD